MIKKYSLLLAVLFSLLVLVSGRTTEAGAWIGIPPWEIQRDIAITKRLTVSNLRPGVGEMVSAEFSLINKGKAPYTFNRIGVSARGPECYNLGCGRNVDFPSHGYITLQPGQTFHFSNQRTFNDAGDYFAQLAFQDRKGNWYSLDSSVNLKVQGPSGISGARNGGTQTVTPIRIETTTNRVNDIFYASFTLHNSATHAVTYKQIGVGVRGPDCGQAFTCGAISDFPYIHNITIPAKGSYTFRNWQQLTKPGSYIAQVAVLNSSHQWEFLGNKMPLSVQPAFNAPRASTFQMSAHYHPRWNESDVRHLNLAKEAGIDLVRIAVEWNRLQPENATSYDQWYSDRLAEFLQRAQAQGVSVYMMVHGTPCWASSDPHKGCQWKKYNPSYPPYDVQDYANVMRELVRRHGHQIVAWEVWNEPNIPRFWANPNPVAYSNLLKAASQAIKAQKPNAVVLGGALAGTDFDFLMGMYSQQANQYYDALSMHPYAKGAPDDCSTNLASYYCGVEGFRAMMLHNRDHKPVWFTEFGWSSLLVGEYNQGQYLQQSLNRIKQWDFVAVATWYNLVDTNSNPNTPAFEHHFGLYRANGQPKPAAAWLKANPH